MGSIPQQKLIYSTTWLKLLVGASSALVLYILYSAKLILGDKYVDALYALAFISGFSERFKVDKLQGIIGNDKQTDEANKKNA